MRKSDQQLVAIKCIEKVRVAGTNEKLLRREVLNLLPLEHPNIMKLHEIYEDQQKFYLVLEHIRVCFFLFFFLSLSWLLVEQFNNLPSRGRSSLIRSLRLVTTLSKTHHTSWVKCYQQSHTCIPRALPIEISSLRISCRLALVLTRRSSLLISYGDCTIFFFPNIT